MSTTTRQQFLIDYLRAHPGVSTRSAVKNLHRHHYTAGEVDAARGKQLTATVTAVTANKVRKTVASLLNQFDDVEKVNRTMKALGQSEYLEDEEMRRTNSIGIDRWRAVKQHALLTPYQFKLPNGRFVWMHTAAQKKLQDAINLSET